MNRPTFPTRLEKQRLVFREKSLQNRFSPRLVYTSGVHGLNNARPRRLRNETRADGWVLGQNKCTHNQQ